MRVNAAKQKMLAGKPAYGYGLGLGSPIAAESLAESGIDFILLDNQHGSFGPESTIASLMAMATTHAVPIPRVARNDYTMIGRMLDEGAMGIVVPMVHTVADAKAAADACRFPPTGIRSWGWGRADRYGDDYSEWINDQLFVAVQIESVTAVENAEAIMATPGVDGCWIGPSDLSLSMGLHPRHRSEDERVLKAVDQVLEACRNTGKIAGYAADGPAQAKAYAERGFRFLTAGSDIGFMLAGASAGVDLLLKG
ncbi:MAG: HpcH/HpaI aldolase family protein [Thermomicrobiales bacterium]